MIILILNISIVHIFSMWKATAGTKLEISPSNGVDDDWDTDPDFVNDVTEQEQRWGSRTVEGSGRTAGAIEYVFFCY